MIECIILMAMVSSIDTLATITGQQGQHLGYKSLACAGDVNDDGYDDFIYTEGVYIIPTYPKVYILYGGAVFDNIPDVVLFYSQTPPFIGKFGWAVGSAGDVNQDGYDDVMVSRCDIEGLNQGEVYIYYGGEDMDGEPDITITDPSPPGLRYQFGYDLCTVDFCFQWPPDNYPDIVVGCPGYSTNPLRGKVYVFRGPNYTDYIELYNPIPDTGYGNDGLGISVTAADFTADGMIDEIVAGAPYWYYRKGVIVAWDAFGNNLNPFYVESPYQTECLFGYDVTSGDVTNDEYPDLVISAPRAGGYDAGRVRLSYGFDNWGFTGIPVDDQELTSLGNYSYFGWSIAHCGDINKDGIGDVIIGAHENSTGVGNGYVALYFGDDGELYNECDLQIFGEAWLDAFGWKVCGAGDMNSDGYADFAVSAPRNDAGGENAGRVYVYGELNLLSSDPDALAYNGNRHLARNQDTGELFLVYTSDGKILYTTSTDEGLTWDYSPFEVGQGSYPAIALSSDGLPAVAWTDDLGLLWYRRQISYGVWGDIWNVDIELPLNSPPSMAITSSAQGDTVHLITTHHWPSMNIYWLVEWSFSIQGPSPCFDYLIEWSEGTPKQYPSVTKSEVDNSLHALWQRADTIYYATRLVGRSWQNWGWQFGLLGLQSAHPFVEAYGDSIFVVWQRMAILSEEVYRAAKSLRNRRFRVQQLTQNYTPTRMPVNVCGRFTVLSDNSSAIWCHDFYEDNWYNISQTPHEWCDYPHAVGNQSNVYTVWLETPTASSIVYVLQFNKLSISIVPPPIPPASESMVRDSYAIRNTSVILSPNPFATELDVKYQTTDLTHKISLKIYDISGKLVRNLYNGTVIGKSVYHWNGVDENGRLVSQGIYILRIENLTTGETSVQKIMKIK